MDDLISWLRGVLDHDETAARATLAELHAGGWLNWGEFNASVFFTIDDRLAGLGDAMIEALDRGDPASVLADIAAKRAILGLHNGDYPYDPDDGPGNYSWTARCQECHSEEPCKTLRLLASAYADRPGYLDEWRPRG